MHDAEMKDVDKKDLLIRLALPLQLCRERLQVGERSSGMDTYFDFVESTHAWKIKEKQVFSLIFAHLIVSLQTK